jgi:hypothetical protein
MQFKKCTGIRQFAFRMVQNDGPAQTATNGGCDCQLELPDSVTTKGESSIRIQLKNPAAGNLAQNIERKTRRSWRYDIDVHNFIFRIDVAIDNECTVQIKMKSIFRIVVAIKERPELGFSKLCR